MRLIPDQNQKVVVTRGYLTGLIGFSVTTTGCLLIGSGAPAWFGITVGLVGLGMMGWTLPHAMSTPQPLDQDRPEAQG